MEVCQKYAMKPVMQENNVSGKNASDINTIQKSIMEIIVDNENKGKKTELGEIGSRLSKKFPEFDIRNYGFSKLSSFVQSLDGIKVDASSRHFFVFERKANNDILAETVYDLLRAEGKMNIGLLNKKIKILCTNVDNKIKLAGYTKFSTYLKNLENIKYIDNNTVMLMK